MRATIVALAALAVLLAVAAPARAQPLTGEADLARPLVLPKGAVLARATVEASLASGALFAPLDLAPDLWVGVTDRLAVGVTHSDAARSGVGDGRGLCLRLAAGVCATRYGGVAADARFRLRDGGVEIAGRVAIDLRRFAPDVAAMELGAVGRWRAGDLAVIAEPYLSLGLVNTELDNHATGHVPIAIAWQVAPRVVVGVATGVRGRVDDFFGTLAVPFTGGVSVAVTGCVDVGASAGWSAVAGPRGGVDDRVAELHVEWRR